MATEIRIPITADGGDFETQLRKVVQSAMSGVVADVNRSMGQVTGSFRSSAAASGGAFRTVDMSGVQRAAQSASGEVTQIAVAAQRASGETSAAFGRVDLSPVTRAADNAAGSLDRVTSAAGQAAGGVNRISGGNLSTAAGNASELAGRLGDVSNRAGSAANETARVGSSSGAVAGLGGAFAGMAGGVGALVGKMGALGAAIGVTVSAASTLSSVFTRGFDRLNAIDQAQAKLRGLGHDAGTVDQVMQSAMASVKGTAFGLGDAAGIAAGAVAAGIKPGQDLTRTLKLVGDTAAIAGVDLADMGDIFSEVAINGEVSGDVIDQLSGRGIPVLQMLGKQLGKTTSEVQDMVSAGEVGFEAFQSALEGGLGGAAVKMGDTFKGAVDNMHAAMGRLGASILEGPFNAAPAIIGNVTAGIDKMTGVVKGAFEVLRTGNGGEAFQKAFGGSEVALSVLQHTRDVVQQVVDVFSRLAGPAGLIGSSLAVASGALGVSTWQLFLTVLELLVPILEVVLVPTLTTIATLMSENQTAVNLLVGAYTAWKSVALVTTVATKGWAVAQGLLNTVMAMNPIGLIVIAIGALVAAIVVAYQNSETFRNIVQACWEGIQTAVSWAWETVLKPVFDAFLVALRWVGEKLMWLWEVVIQPVFGWIGDLIGWWWDKVQLVWALWGAALEVAGEALRRLWVNYIQPVLSWIGDRYTWLWQSVIQPVLGWIGERWQWLYDTVIAPVAGFVADKLTQLGGFFVALWEKIRDAAGWIMGKLGELRDWFGGLVGTILEALGRPAKVLWDWGVNLIQGLLDGAGSLLSKIGEFFLSKLPGWIKEPFKKALGIASPSKVFAGFGTNVVKGLQGGIEKQVPKIAATMRQVSDAVEAVPLSAPSVALPAVQGAGVAVPDGVAGFDPSVIDTGAAAAQAALTATGGVAQAVYVPAMQVSQQATASLGAQAAATATGQVVPATALIQTAAQTTGRVMQEVAAGQVNPALAAVGSAANQLAVGVQDAAGGRIVPAWQSMAAQLEATRAGAVDPTMNALRNAVNATADTFRTGTDLAAQHWGRLRQATADPVRWTIDQVFNGGVVRSWNAVSEMLGTKAMSPIPIGFKSGGFVGRVRGQGGGIEDRVSAGVPYGSFILRSAAARKVDAGNLSRLNRLVAGGDPAGGAPIVPAKLSRGEVWLSPPVVRMLGVANLDRFNKTGGDPQGLFPNLRYADIAARYSGGGLAVGSPAWQALKRGHDWARSRSGRPYVLGGSADGGGGTDCSGYQSGIADVILGGSGRRQWATMSFNGGGNSQYQSGPQGFRAGLAAGFSIGVLNGGPAGGHTAGTLGGVPGLPTVNVESGGSHGRVQYGAPAVGADHAQFPTRYHLPVADVLGRFAAAGPGGGVVDFAALVREQIDPIWQQVAGAVAGARFGGGVGEVPPSAKATMQRLVTDKLVSLAEALSVFDPDGSGVERFRPMVTALLRKYGLPDGWVNNTLRRMNQESAGNTRAVNDWDVNWQAGHPSVGLMQVIGPTYARHKDPSLDRGPYMYGVSIDPMSNTAASMRYAMATYGSLPAGYDRSGGYARGGLVGGRMFDRGGIASGLGFMAKNILAPERILSPKQTALFDQLVSSLGKLGSTGVATLRGGSVGELVRVFHDEFSKVADAVGNVLPDQFKQILSAVTAPQVQATTQTRDAVQDLGKSVKSGSGFGQDEQAFDEVSGKLVREQASLFHGRTYSSRAAVMQEQVRVLVEQGKKLWNDVISPGVSKGVEAWRNGGDPLQILQAAGGEMWAKVGEQVANGFRGQLKAWGINAPFDQGGVAAGAGFLPKNVLAPERVLSPRQTSAFESLLPMLERLQGWQVPVRSRLGSADTAGPRMVDGRRITIHSPFTVNARGGRELAEAGHNRLLALLDS